jgi:hypothetical protein
LFPYEESLDGGGVAATTSCRDTVCMPCSSSSSSWHSPAVGAPWPVDRGRERTTAGAVGGVSEFPYATRVRYEGHDTSYQTQAAQGPANHGMAETQEATGGSGTSFETEEDAVEVGGRGEVGTSRSGWMGMPEVSSMPGQRFFA